jgi:chromosome segregation ATPase
MKRLSLFPLTLLLVFPAALAQTVPTDSDTLKALLSEVRLLRHDLQTTTVAAQRAQILIYRVQAQESIVGHIQERVDNARLRLSQVRFEQKSRAASIKQIEEKQSRSETPASEKKDLEDALAQEKARFDADANSEQETQTTLIDAEEQLRIAQAKLGGLQEQLDRLEKGLESIERQK